jgi:hypothetical protein
MARPSGRNTDERNYTVARHGFIAKRQGNGSAPRTVSLDIIALRNVLNRAIDDGWIKSLPTENLRPLKVDQCKYQLVTREQLEGLFATSRSLPLSRESLLKMPCI